MSNQLPVKHWNFNGFYDEISTAKCRIDAIQSLTVYPCVINKHSIPDVCIYQSTWPYMFEYAEPWSICGDYFAVDIFV